MEDFAVPLSFGTVLLVKRQIIEPKFQSVFEQPFVASPGEAIVPVVGGVHQIPSELSLSVVTRLPIPIGLIFSKNFSNLSR